MTELDFFFKFLVSDIKAEYGDKIKFFLGIFFVPDIF